MHGEPGVERGEIMDGTGCQRSKVIYETLKGLLVEKPEPNFVRQTQINKKILKSVKKNSMAVPAIFEGLRTTY